MSYCRVTCAASITMAFTGALAQQVALDTTTLTAPGDRSYAQSPSGVHWLSQRNGTSASVVRTFDSNGQPLWSRSFTDSTHLTVLDLTSDGASGAYCVRPVGGQSLGGTNDVDTMRHSLQVCHIAFDGSMDWTTDIHIKDLYSTSIGWSNLWRASVTRLADGSIVCLAIFHDMSRWRWNLNKLSASGDLIWSRQVGLNAPNPSTYAGSATGQFIVADGAGGVYLVGTQSATMLTFVAHVDGSGDLDWFNQYEYTNGTLGGDIYSAGLLADGSLGVFSWLALSVNDYGLLMRIGIDGALLRADLYDGAVQPQQRGSLFGRPDGSVVILGGLRDVDLLRISSDASTAIAHKRTAQVGQDALSMMLSDAELVGNKLGIGALLKYEDIVFANVKFQPTLDLIDLDADLGCMWQTSSLAHNDVPAVLMLTTPLANAQAQDIDLLNSASPGTFTFEPVPDLDTEELCALISGIEIQAAETTPLLQGNVVSLGSNAIVISDAGNIAMLSPDGRLVGSFQVRGSNTRTLIPVRGISIGAYHIIWHSGDGSMVRRDRLIVQ